MSNAAALIAQLRAQREIKVEVAPSKFIVVRRPRATEIEQFIQEKDGKRLLAAEVQHVVKYACRWENIAETDLFPPGVGGSDLVDFTPELFAEVLPDKPDWSSKCANKLLDAIVDHQTRTKAEAGNSEPSST